MRTMALVRALFSILALLFCSLQIAACGEIGGKNYIIPARQSPALWRITDPATGARGYVMGSVHMLPDGLNWMTPTIKSAVADATVLVTEIDRNSGSLEQFDVMASDNPVAPLSERLAPPDLARAARVGDMLDLSMAAMNATESWALAITLARGQAADLNLSQEKGVEAELQREFSRQSKAFYPLESAMDQYHRFDALPPSAQDLMLHEGLKPASPRADFQVMLTAWLRGDVAALAHIADTGLTGHRALRSALLEAPNQIWASKIAALLHDNRRPFVAIGAAHVVGPTNILTHLRKSSMIVERIQ